MSSDTTPHTLPDLLELGISLSQSKVILQASQYAKEHCDPMVYNHTLRTACWGLIIAQKVPHFSNVDRELVVVASILHDLGWAKTKELLSNDKRFEVDGANAAKDFLSKNDTREGQKWDEARLQRTWDAIALHTTPSIAVHAAPEVAVTHLAVVAEFMGPALALGPDQPKLITLDEYKAVTKVFPRTGFTFEGLKGLMCGLCRDKPETTYDNFVGRFGLNYGLDGNGKDKEKFAEALEASQFVHLAKFGLDQLEALDSQ
ncbi:hypothetical protein FSARC_4106 [Fusarium sarcochroum]|uniref:HD domain-containing protein n=1 Tax=Fusarium sarcochroum TaxID=1208366 RepID=A0A8H4XBX2_9HYPO|nr:hypothetical protein FSARC_4106 [Fusarium sarcochroum]